MQLAKELYIGIVAEQFDSVYQRVYAKVKKAITQAQNIEQLDDNIKQFQPEFLFTGVFPMENKYHPFLFENVIIQTSKLDYNLSDWMLTSRKYKAFPILIIVDDSPYKDIMASLTRLESFLRYVEDVSAFAFVSPFVIFLISNYFHTVLEFNRQVNYPLVYRKDVVNEVIDRSIEFPPEYYSAGLGILNFFGTYLREQYPEENAKVKIEQDGLIVRLIVSTTDGRAEVIEKALQEYQLIISGAEVPEAIIYNERLILELKHELRIASVRIETQNDIIHMQQATIAKFTKFLELSLSNHQPINIEVNPVITSLNSFSVTFNISQALKDLANLKAELPSNTKAHNELQEVEKAIDAIKNETNPNVVKHSSAMSKFGDFIKKFSGENDKVDKAFEIGKKGWETFKQLAGTYNSIAQWCGLPQVPTIFTK